MTNTKEAPSSNPTKAVALITIHGMQMIVVEHQETKYVQLKPLSDLVSLQWKATKRTLFSQDNADLYGAIVLPPPPIEGLGVPRHPLREATFIRLDRVYMFLARVNTGQMRINGNETGADLLLSIQKEWAQALHDYETLGVAVKQQRGAERKQLLDLVRARNMATRPSQQHAIDRMIDEALAEMGYPVEMERQRGLDLPPRAH